MQNPNEDTEWNDVLRQKGIIPPKEKEVTEDDIVQMVEESVKGKTKDSTDPDDLTLDELKELEDEEDEEFMRFYTNKRMAELRAMAEKSRFGEVLEITAKDYVNEVNKAGEGIWVVLHLYQQGVPLCTLINQHLRVLAKKFPATKFIKSISTTCIPNYPDKNLPTIFVYLEGTMKAQIIGPAEFRYADITADDLEWRLGKIGAFESTIEENPRPKTVDVLQLELGRDEDADDW